MPKVSVQKRLDQVNIKRSSLHNSSQQNDATCSILDETPNRVERSQNIECFPVALLKERHLNIMQKLMKLNRMSAKILRKLLKKNVGIPKKQIGDHLPDIIFHY